jgi:hypothetical protein
MSLPIDDVKLILGASDSVSSITETSSSTPSRSGLGRGRQTFARNRDKRKVMFMDQQSEDATTSTKPTTDSTDDDLVDDIMGQFDVDFDTLCVHVAECKQEELKAEGKHPHHRPTKRTANPVVAPTDVDIDGVVYLVKMADCGYRVSTNNHSEATGALIDRGANGGIAGNDCRVIEVNDQPHRYVNVEGIDGHVIERHRLVTAGAVTHSNRGPVILIMHQYAPPKRATPSILCPNWNGMAST